MPSTSPQLSNLNQDWSYEVIEVMKNFSHKNTTVPNIGHVNAPTVEFVSHDKILLVTSQTEILKSQTLDTNTFILNRPAVANSETSLKLQSLIKETFKP